MITVAILLLTGTAPEPALAQGRGGPVPTTPSDVRAVPVQGNIYMLVGAGANLTVSVGDMGMLLVDTGERASAEKVLAALRALSPRPLQFILNTGFHESYTGANEILAKAGRRVTDGPNAQSRGSRTRECADADEWPKW